VVHGGVSSNRFTGKPPGFFEFAFKLGILHRGKGKEKKREGEFFVSLRYGRGGERGDPCGSPS
jgi:hypothetical protein